MAARLDLRQAQNGTNLCDAIVTGAIINFYTAVPSAMDEDPLSVEVPREFHRRMAAIIEAVQTGIWQRGVHDLLGYATDYAFGDKRGLQTLVLKSKSRSAYVRLQWETIMADTDADRKRVEEVIKNAINELG
jgi:hypothetical protein